MLLLGNLVISLVISDLPTFGNLVPMISNVKSKEVTFLHGWCFNA